MGSPAKEMAAIEQEVVRCVRCPRLVAWREESAAAPPRRYAGQQYWARPVPGFGDPAARLFVLGLAPAAHGANRTGRMFTGDRSGDFLYAALHRAGFASQPNSVHANDGLELRDAWISATVRCAPPANKPLPEERDACVEYARREFDVLRPAVVLALGGFAWDGALAILRDAGVPIPTPRPRFAHGAEVALGGLLLVGTYHPSQQNTFTGRLTPEMLDAVLARAAAALREPGRR